MWAAARASQYLPNYGRRGARACGVYRRVGKPCFECRTPIVSRQSGDLARTTYFCPACQQVAEG